MFKQPSKFKFVLVAVLLGLTVATGFTNLNNSKQVSDPIENKPQISTPPQIANTPNNKLKACDVLLLDDAKKLIGPNAEQAKTIEPSSNGEVNGMALSLCGFQAKQKNGTIENFAISLQTSMDQQAYEAYLKSRPTQHQAISGYGSDAYWLVGQQQLNIYIDGNWLKISVFNLENGNDYLKFAKSVADIVVVRL